MHVGLIAGIGPAATDFYYRRIIAALAARQMPLELTMVHADTPTLLRNQMAGDAAAQVALSVDYGDGGNACVATAGQQAQHLGDVVWRFGFVEDAAAQRHGGIPGQYHFVRLARHGARLFHREAQRIGAGDLALGGGFVDVGAGDARRFQP